MDTTQSDVGVSLKRLVLLGIAARLLVDTGVQIFNPFLAIIAAGLGTNVVVMGRLVSLRSIMGLVAPALGTLADRLGYRLFMRLALLLGAAGLLLVGVSSTVWLAAVGMCVMGIGMAAFTPTLQAYLSDHLSYARRARGLATVEYSWALAGILGLSLAGFLIEATSWRVPFFLLSGGMVVAWYMFGRLPKDSRTQKTAASDRVDLRLTDNIREFFHLGDNARSAWSSIAALALVFFASNQIILMHGAWLEREYSLTAAQLGTVALLLGLADLSGSVLVSLIGDRIGKRRSLLGAVGLSCVAYAILPMANVGIVAVIVGLALTRFSFEMSVVSMLPLLSEQVPSQRAKLLTMGIATSLVGVAVGGVLAPWLYTNYGVLGLGSVSTVSAAGALVIVWFLVDEISVTHAAR